MKKNLLYLFAVICTASFFTACSDDDEKVDESWKEIAGTYKTDSLNLNGETVKDETISVAIEALTAGTGSVELNNIVIGEAKVKLDVTLEKLTNATATKGYAYSLKGESSNDDRQVSVEGTVSDGILTIKTTYKVVSPVVGAWNLNIAEDPSIGNSLSADIVMNVEGAEGSDMMVQFMKPIIGQLLAQKVESVTVNYGEDGKLGISFKTTEAGGNAESIMAIINMLDLRYYVQTTDGKSQLYLAINKTFLEMGGQMMGEEMLAAIKSLMVEAGNYYALPLNMAIDGNSAQFYVSKDFLVKVLPIVTPLVPADLAAYISMLEGLITGATTFDLGLGFSK